MKQVQSRTSKVKNQEVEIRARLTSSQRAGVFGKLKSLGAKRGETEILDDIYFCPVRTKKFSQVEMNKVGSYSLRLRHQSKSDKIHTDLNIKVITQHGDHRSWREHETRIENIHEAKQILGFIGFKSFFELKKTRYPFRLGKFSVLVEDIEGFGPALEIEVMTDRANSEKAKKRIKELFDRLGIKPDQIVPKSVTNLIMKKRAKF
jgi:adenylate cyclase, class 2